MYKLNLNPTTGRRFAPTNGDLGEEQEVIEVLPLETPATAPVEPSPSIDPVPAGV